LRSRCHHVSFRTAIVTTSCWRPHSDNHLAVCGASDFRTVLVSDDRKSLKAPRFIPQWHRLCFLPGSRALSRFQQTLAVGRPDMKSRFTLTTSSPHNTVRCDANCHEPAPGMVDTAKQFSVSRAPAARGCE